jgi:hypothetical protein
VNLPVTPKLLQQHPWVKASELDAKLVAGSSVPEMGLILSQIRDAIKTSGVPTRYTLSLNNAGASLTLEKDGNFVLRVYSPTNHLGVHELEKAHAEPAETVRFEGRSYTHTVNGTELRGTF